MQALGNDMFTSRSNAGQVFIPGGAGPIQTVIDPASTVPPRGIALIAHPHPLFGGTLDNKVVQTLARAFAELGYVALRPNFRGVGESAGTHDKGDGETTDMLAVLDYAWERYGQLPVVLGGFSFGGFVQTRVARALAERGAPPERLVLVAPAVGRINAGSEAERSYDTTGVPSDTLVIHGDEDATVPLANVRAWAEPQGIPVHVISGSDHFFHRKLGEIKSIIKDQWQ